MKLEKSVLEKVRELAYKYALLNALKHNGRAELKPVIAKIIGEMPEIRRNIRDIIGLIREVIIEVNKLSIEEQLKIVKSNWPELLEEKREKEKKELEPLPNAVPGKVVTRFAPNPDYTIHLGNARPALLSYWYAQMYKGKMILRFEDTDPRTKAPFPEAYERIKEDLRWLGISWNEEYIQSLRIPIFYNILRELIKRGGAYVDKCKPEEFRKYRDAGKPCPHRELAVEKHMEEFDRILEGYYSEGEAVIRVKTDLSHPDPSVRDWVAARIIDTSKSPHPVVGEKYMLWPTYNLAAATDDHLMGVTHILRAKEHVSNTIKQKYFYDHMGWKYPETIHFGRLSLEGVILSKSKMRKLTREKNLEPYIDPRFGTLAGLRRRGISREALWEIIKSVGVNPVDAHISYVNLAAINRSIIDPIANRYMAVEEPVKVKLEGLSRNLIAHIPRHLARKEYVEYIVSDKDPFIYISRKDVARLKLGEVFRLMGLANFKLLEPTIDREHGLIARALLQSIEQLKSKEVPIIQWVPTTNNVVVELIVPTGDNLCYKSLIAEKSIIEEKVGSIVQFYRIGFARLDKIEENFVRAIFAHS